MKQFSILCTHISLYSSIDTHSLSLSSKANHWLGIRLFLQLLHPWFGQYNSIMLSVVGDSSSHVSLCTPALCLHRMFCLMECVTEQRSLFCTPTILVTSTLSCEPANNDYTPYTSFSNTCTYNSSSSSGITDVISVSSFLSIPNITHQVINQLHILQNTQFVKIACSKACFVIMLNISHFYRLGSTHNHRHTIYHGE